MSDVIRPPGYNAPLESVPDLFLDRHTGLDDIEAAGWKRWGGTGGWHGFQLVKDHAIVGRYPVPSWLKQLVAEAYASGVAEVKAEMRQALGFEDPA